MNVSDSFFSETNSKAKHKLCGNCGRVSFGLNKAETEFLNEKLRWCKVWRGRRSVGISLETMRRWLRRKNHKMPGSRSHLDVGKNRVVEIVLAHKIYCPAAKAHVICLEEGCFLWLP